MSSDTSTPKTMKPIALLREVGTLRSLAKLPLARARRHQSPCPHGSGTPVMTLPGFGSGDAAMLPLRRRLRRHGFRTFKWQLGLNRGNVPELIPLASERVAQLVAQQGEPVALVGWSLGGYIAREVARENPTLVSQVITLASPIIGGPKYTAVAGFYRQQGIDVDAIEAAVREREQVAIEVPITCVFSRNDGVVDWRAVIDHNNPSTENIEVTCTHLAMGFDPDVLDIVVATLLNGSKRRSG